MNNITLNVLFQNRTSAGSSKKLKRSGQIKTKIEISTVWAYVIIHSLTSPTVSGASLIQDISMMSRKSFAHIADRRTTLSLIKFNILGQRTQGHLFPN